MESEELYGGRVRVDKKQLPAPLVDSRGWPTAAPEQAVHSRPQFYWRFEWSCRRVTLDRAGGGD